VSDHLTLRRRPLYPAELQAHIEKALSFFAALDRAAAVVCPKGKRKIRAGVPGKGPAFSGVKCRSILLSYKRILKKHRPSLPRAAVNDYLF